MLNLTNKKGFLKIYLSIKYIAKWSSLAVLVGIVVGFAAVAFTSALNWGIDLLINLRETNWVYILPIFGLFMSGWITSTFAPEAAGHGTDAIIKSYNERWGQVKVIVVPVKLIASVFTIAFGGSAGREGPTVQMGGGLGYLIGKKLNLKLTDIRKIVICGMGASFGSIFTAPIAGGIFGAEVLYRDDTEYNSLFISFISSITAYFIYSVILKQTSLFKFPIPADFTFIAERDILFYIIVGVFIGIISLIYIKALYSYEHFNEKLTIASYFKTALGGLFTGVTALFISTYIMGTGISLTEKITLQSSFSASFLLLLLIGKIAATSFTIGSGGSGGVVAPSLTIGALAGAFLAKVLNYPYPVALISACSVGLLGSAAHIPITTTLLAAEIYGLELIKPATIVSFIAAWIAKNDTLYRESYISKSKATKVIHHFGEL